MRSTAGSEAAQGGCDGKKSYGSYWAAKRAAHGLNRFRDTSRANPYRCPSCRCFHVGNTLGIKQRKRYSRHDERDLIRRGRITFSEQGR